MDRLKPLFALAGSFLLLSSCGLSASSKGESSHEGESSAISYSELPVFSAKTTAESYLIQNTVAAPIYLGNLKAVQGYDINVYNLAGHEDIPYINVAESAPLLDVLNIMVNNSGELEIPELEMLVRGQTLSIKNFSGETVSFDAHENKITYSDLLGYNTNFFNREKGQLLAEAEFTYVKTDENRTVESKSYTIDLNSYRTLAIIEDEGEFYIPWSLAKTVFFNELPLVYNGKAIYYAAAGYTTTSSGLNSYGKSLYEGSKFGKEWSSSFTEYNYDAFCLDMDKNFGNAANIQVPKTQSNFNSYFSANGLRDKLLSGDPTTFSTTIASIVNVYFGDGHSTYSSHSGISFGETWSASAQANRANTLFQSERYSVLASTNSRLSYARKRTTHGSDLLYVLGDTAFVTFDGFKESASVNAYDDMNDNGSLLESHTGSDTMYDFLYSFQQIQKNEKIKNIVFDVSLNGGGVIGALVNALGLLEEQVDVTFRENANGALIHDIYRVDANLDGKIEDGESYKGKYNFYCLTSNYSFSCGNLFPTIFRKDNIGKVIGEKSGGGSCVVYSTVTPSGCFFNVSGAYVLQMNKEGTADNDGGVTPDIAIDPKKFYNRTYIASLLN